jgi:hypothetical protein
MESIFESNYMLDENKDEESKDIILSPFYYDSFENKNVNNDQLFNDDSQNFFFFYNNFYETPNYKTELNKDDKFNGELGLNEGFRSKTEVLMLEKTRDTETSGKDTKFKDKNPKESETIFNQEKHDENIIKNSSKNNNKIFYITKEYEREKIKGRKRKGNFGGNGKHDKFCKDNIVRKVKTNLFEIILFFINFSITPIEKENKNKNSKKKIIYKPFLVKIDQEIIKTINVEENLKLINSKLKDIFSNKTSKKYVSLGLDKNKQIIDEIYEQKIQKKTISILNKTFEQCLEHINGINYDEDLAGLEHEYQRILKKLRIKENEDYISKFKDMVKNFKFFYMNKKARKKIE